MLQRDRRMSRNVRTVGDKLPIKQSCHSSTLPSIFRERRIAPIALMLGQRENIGELFGTDTTTTSRVSSRSRFVSVTAHCLRRESSSSKAYASDSRISDCNDSCFHFGDQDVVRLSVRYHGGRVDVFNARVPWGGQGNRASKSRIDSCMV